MHILVYYYHVLYTYTIYAYKYFVAKLCAYYCALIILSFSYNATVAMFLLHSNLTSN